MSDGWWSIIYTGWWGIVYPGSWNTIYTSMQAAALGTLWRSVDVHTSSLLAWGSRVWPLVLWSLLWIDSKWPGHNPVSGECPLHMVRSQLLTIITTTTTTNNNNNKNPHHPPAPPLRKRPNCFDNFIYSMQLFCTKSSTDLACWLTPCLLIHDSKLLQMVVMPDLHFNMVFVFDRCVYLFSIIPPLLPFPPPPPLLKALHIYAWLYEHMLFWCLIFLAHTFYILAFVLVQHNWACCTRKGIVEKKSVPLLSWFIISA